jgi:hypothetical protein
MLDAYETRRRDDPASTNAQGRSPPFNCRILVEVVRLLGARPDDESLWPEVAEFSADEGPVDVE